MNIVRRSLRVLIWSVLLVLSFGAGSAMAATYTVDDYTYANNDGDCGGDGDCSFLEAINAADANVGQDTIAFSGSWTVTITDASLVLDPQATDALGIILDCDGDVKLAGGAIAGPQIIGPSTVKGCTLTVERSEEHTSELQSRLHLLCPFLL